MTERIGFIGVGLMGHGMAKNLLAKGHPLTFVAHRNRANLQDLLDGGAREAKSADALAEASDIVFLCVTGSPQVEANVYGERGLLAACRSGTMVVDCSTSEPDSTLRIRADFAAKGVEFVDAPLARTPREAEAGKLNVMVGATDAVLAKRRAAMEARGKDAWKPNRERKVSRALQAYAKMATSAAFGAVRDVDRLG